MPCAAQKQTIRKKHVKPMIDKTAQSSHIVKSWHQRNATEGTIMLQESLEIVWEIQPKKSKMVRTCSKRY